MTDQQDICASYNWEIGTLPQVPLHPPEWAGRDRPIAIDHCIAPVVKALWDAGHVTLGSCCGHNREGPSLVLDNSASPEEVARIRAWIATVDPREFTLYQWQLREV